MRTEITLRVARAAATDAGNRKMRTLRLTKWNQACVSEAASCYLKLTSVAQASRNRVTSGAPMRGVTTFETIHEPYPLKGRGWIYFVQYLGPTLPDKTSYVQQLMRDGCELNGVSVLPIGVEAYAMLALPNGAGIGLLLKERLAG